MWTYVAKIQYNIIYLKVLVSGKGIQQKANKQLKYIHKKDIYLLYLTNVSFQFNFVGKLLGPKGNSLKRMQEETLTKMAVLGRGSMRDKEKEEEMRKSGDPKYSHLQVNDRRRRR